MLLNKLRRRKRGKSWGESLSKKIERSTEELGEDGGTGIKMVKNGEARMEKKEKEGREKEREGRKS